MQHELPTGTVTLLFTDIEGSTRLLSELGAEPYEEVLAEHRRLLRGAFARRGGVEVDTQGDAFFYAFPSAPEAIEAAAEGQQALSAGPIRRRVDEAKDRTRTVDPLLTMNVRRGSIHAGFRVAVPLSDPRP